jgi:hypothetical protein
MESRPESLIPPVPIEYAGKWIAWNKDRSKIIASGATIVEAMQAAQATGEADPIYAKAPRANFRWITCGLSR